jgi:hypothetical protein
MVSTICHRSRPFKHGCNGSKPCSTLIRDLVEQTTKNSEGSCFERIDHMLQSPYCELFHVRLCGKGKGLGLFTSIPFEGGESLYRFDYWSHSVMPIHMTNHSCEPNAAFCKDGMLIALRNLNVNEEISYDYLASPIPASPWNFECDCKSRRCLGWIDARKLPSAHS